MQYVEKTKQLLADFLLEFDRYNLEWKLMNPGEYLSVAEALEF